MNNLHPHEQLLKKLIWSQLGEIRGKTVLDFGSGNGVTADYFAAENDVTAIEVSGEMLLTRRTTNKYRQLIGSAEVLADLDDGTFDLILCHNVLEYVPDRDCVVREFVRLLKPDGVLSVVKHNRLGRAMESVVRGNDFDGAVSLLDGGKIETAYGYINYFEDGELAAYGLRIARSYGIGAFWYLQQDTRPHGHPLWQERMMAMEAKAAEVEEYRAVAAFRHLILGRHSQNFN